MPIQIDNFIFNYNELVSELGKILTSPESLYITL
jgi:hypothetical protein